MRAIKNSYFVFISLAIGFFTLFSVNFKALPSSTLVIVFCISVIWLLLHVLTTSRIGINRIYLGLLYLFIIQVGMYLISLLLSNSVETSQFVVMFVFFLVNPLISYFIISYFWKSQLSVNKVIVFFISIILVQSVLTLLISFVPSVQQFLLDVIDVDFQRLVRDSSRRLVGFGTSYFHLGTIMSLGFFLGVFSLYKQLPRTLFGYFSVYLSLMFFLVVGFFAARTTVVAVVFIIFMYWIFKFDLKLSKKSIIALILLVLAIPFFIALSSRSESISIFYSRSIPWAAEIFINLFSGKGVQTDSTDHLLNQMYFLPDTLKTLLIGDARMYREEGGYYMSTDAGFIRQIFSYGLIGMIISFIVYGYVLFIISKVFGAFFSFTLAGLIILFNIKGIFIYYSNYEFFISFCFVASIIILNQRKKYAHHSHNNRP
ncbi:hypothetical protein HX037_05150 [Ignatzschineria indica]|uniref:hypothetical protein n=1 Tax=Ignatzschineria indica TaxID=472583 RepID=UPI0025782753|nr:hypothetical protein [Ignatzschineria indica]MDM1545269.1 hypothetical protein [Ignatzschineria indica]